MVVKVVHSYNKNGDEILPNYKPKIPALEELLDRIFTRIAWRSDTKEELVQQRVTQNITI